MTLYNIVAGLFFKLYHLCSSVTAFDGQQLIQCFLYNGRVDGWSNAVVHVWSASEQSWFANSASLSTSGRSVKAVSAVSRRELAHAHVHRITRTHARLYSHQMVESRRRSNGGRVLQRAALLVSLGGRFLWSHLRMRPFTIAFPANRLRSWIFLLVHMVTSCQLGSV